MRRLFAAVALLLAAGCERVPRDAAETAAPPPSRPAGFAAPEGWRDMAMLPAGATQGHVSPDGAASLVLTETPLPPSMSAGEAKAVLQAAESEPPGWRRAGLRQIARGYGRHGAQRYLILDWSLGAGTGAVRLRQYVLAVPGSLLVITGSAPAERFEAVATAFDTSAGSLRTDGDPE